MRGDFASLIGPIVPETPEMRDAEQLSQLEDQKERVELASAMSPLALACLAMLLPVWTSFRMGPRSIEIYHWILFNLPLLVLIWMLLWRGRIPLGEGRSARGGAAIWTILLMLLANMLFLFGPAALWWIVDRLPTAG
jgi:hypothetical protein